jgi:hypothetical protein
MDNWKPVRDHCVALLQGGQAYDTLEDIVASLEDDKRFAMPPGAERSAWQIVEHMRIALRDILDFTTNADGRGYQERSWPDDYWPKTTSPLSRGGWKESVDAYLADRRRLESMVADQNADLFAPFPWGSGQTLLRQTLLAADHAAYHCGELVIVQRLLGGA